MLASVPFLALVSIVAIGSVSSVPTAAAKDGWRPSFNLFEPSFDPTPLSETPTGHQNGKAGHGDVALVFPDPDIDGPGGLK